MTATLTESPSFSEILAQIPDERRTLAKMIQDSGHSAQEWLRFLSEENDFLRMHYSRQQLTAARASLSA